MSQPRFAHATRWAAAAFLGGALVLGTCGVAAASTSAARTQVRASTSSLSARSDGHHHGYWYWHHRTYVCGRVTALGTNSVTLKRCDGATGTFTTTSSTLYFEGGSATTASALALGEAVDLVLTGHAPQTVIRLTIDVVHWSGVVSGVTGASISIGPTSSPRTVVTSSATTFIYANGTAATLADVLAGDTISAKGVNTPTAGTIDANSVVIHPATLSTHVCGRITALGAGSVTLKRCDGATGTFTTASTTLYFEGGTATAASALALGEAVDLVLTPTAPQTVVRLTIDVVHWTGVVSGVTGASIAIGSASSPRTIVTSSATTFIYGNGTAATLADVLAGDSVSAKGVNTPTAGTIDANSVVIYPATLATHVSGRVTGLGASSVTVKRSNGTSVTFPTTSSTLYYEGDSATTSAALALGEAVSLDLTSSAPQSVVSVSISLVKFVGRVMAVNGDVITVTSKSGVTEMVTVSASTVYTLAGGGAASFSSVLTGDQIEAIGVNGVGNLTLNASSVVIGSFL